MSCQEPTMKRDDLAAARVPVQPSTEDADDFVDGDEPADDEAGPPRDIAVAEEPAELDERGKRILAFEKQWWRRAGAKEQAIRDTFGLSATRYYQLLNALLDDPLALAHDAMVVQRLRRVRASRTRRR
ncbi:DUF3263 domain-containing protein [Dactylosporangium sp. NPDC048998]|uniref:DUF3263 domain-containing protein n=1 Tax=Dactylosporangium sp. NPDC048998 TaxID=3363976 RepID=UPI00371D704D